MFKTTSGWVAFTLMVLAFLFFVGIKPIYELKSATIEKVSGVTIEWYELLWQEMTRR